MTDVQKHDPDKTERDRFIAALKWYFADKPTGSKSDLTRRIGMSSSYVSSALSGKTRNKKARTLISTGIDVPYDVMLETGRVILEGGHPGPSLPIFPRETLDGKPFPDPLGDFAQKMPPPSAAAVKQFAAFRLPLALDGRLIPDKAGNPSFAEDVPANFSPVVYSTTDLAGINPEFLRAVRITDSAMDPVVCAGDIVIVDTARNSAADIMEGQIFMISSSTYLHMACVPRFLSWVDIPSQIMTYVAVPRRCNPELVDFNNVRIMGIVIQTIRLFTDWNLAFR
jgi:hypothetical protein